MGQTLSVAKSNIEIINAALEGKLGVPKISSLEENSMAARTARASYANALEDAISSYPWRFARNRIEVQRLDDAPIAPWSGMYQIPEKALAVHAAYEEDQKTLFDVFGRRVAVMIAAGSTSRLFLEVSETASPDAWPGYFREAFITLLAANMAMPLTSDERLSLKLEKKADTLMMRARSRDAQGRSSSRIDTKMFIRQRRSGRRS